MTNQKWLLPFKARKKNYENLGVLPYDTYTIELDGLTFQVAYHYDGDMGEPWKVHEGHGVVSEWTTRDKSPGERILNQDRTSKRYYDFMESVKIALRDGWGDGKSADGRTKRQIAASAVELDYARMKAWCDDEWHWMGIVVTLLDTDGHKTNETENLWGIESDSGDYRKETALELAGEIVSRVPEDGRLTVQVR